MTLVRPPKDDNEKPENLTPVVLRGRKEKVIQPLHVLGNNPAADLIRKKLDRLYAEEPDALQEEKEAEIIKPRSKHQEFMYSLSNSGRSFAEIQVAWHNYYSSLSDEEKHQVWQEFYENNSPSVERIEASKPKPEPEPEPETTSSLAPKPKAKKKTETKPSEPKAKTPTEKIIVANEAVSSRASRLRPRTDPRALKDIKKQVVEKVAANTKTKEVARSLHSLFFGLACGAIVIVIVMFGFFNEVVIAPFIQPSRKVSAMPIIVSSTSSDAYKDPRIIIPKINIEIPVDYNETTIDEDAIQNGLENGVVHYPITVNPGQNGNAAFFGHSSSNIFNNGKYKFAFVLLHELEVGDTFYLTKDGKIYIYQIFKKFVVPPTDVSVLDDIPGETATATLITCDPPGRNINRLIVVGRQISPDPASNSQGTNTASTAVPQNTELPGNGPSAWSRFWHWVF